VELEDPESDLHTDPYEEPNDLHLFNCPLFAEIEFWIACQLLLCNLD
jgi:hypothetical protein